MKKNIGISVAIIVGIIVICPSVFSGTIEDIRNKVGWTDRMQQGGNVKNVIEIQSVSKGVVNSWVKDQGVGMRMLRCINVKFKVYQNGKVELPYIKCYVYDRNRKLLRTFNRYLELTSSGSMQPAILNVFDGNRTTTIQFVYPETLDFKYAIAVVGNDTNGVFARTLPRNADLNNFSFPEKTLLKK